MLSWCVHFERWRSFISKTGHPIGKGLPPSWPQRFQLCGPLLSGPTKLCRSPWVSYGTTEVKGSCSSPAGLAGLTLDTCVGTRAPGTQIWSCSVDQCRNLSREAGQGHNLMATLIFMHRLLPSLSRSLFNLPTFIPFRSSNPPTSKG